MSSTTTAYKPVPGPGFFRFIKNVRANPVMYCYGLMKQYGDVVRCRSLQDIYLVSNPAHAKEIFLNSQKLFDKNNFINNRLRKLMGDGLVVTNGEKWKRQRMTAQVLYKKEELQKLEPGILRQINTMLEEWEQLADGNRLLNVNKQVRELVMKIMAGCFFPLDDPEVLQRLKEDFFTGNAYVSNPTPFNLPAWVPLSRKARLAKAMQNIDNSIMKMMDERPRTEKYEGKLLAHIMDQRDEEGNKLSRDEILAEIKNIFVSSFFSTSDFLSWMIYSLAQYPAWAEKIFEECKNGADEINSRPPELFLNMQLFIHETLRCYPPGWASTHRTLQPLHLDGYLVPANTSVLVSIYNLHHHPGYWEEPEKFNPLRFAAPDWLKEKAIFIPFGLGPRKCIGMGLAGNIINLLCAKVVSHFRLRVNESVPPVIQSRVSLGAKYDLEIFLEKR